MTIDVIQAALRRAMPIPDRNHRGAPVMAIPSIFGRTSLITIIEPAR
jgi:hypothetical protein